MSVAEPKTRRAPSPAAGRSPAKSIASTATRLNTRTAAMTVVWGTLFGGTIANLVVGLFLSRIVANDPYFDTALVLGAILGGLSGYAVSARIKLVRPLQNVVFALLFAYSIILFEPVVTAILNR